MMVLSAREDPNTGKDARGPTISILNRLSDLDRRLVDERAVPALASNPRLGLVPVKGLFMAVATAMLASSILDDVAPTSTRVLSAAVWLSLVISLVATLTGRARSLTIRLGSAIAVVALGFVANVRVGATFVVVATVGVLGTRPQLPRSRPGGHVPVSIS